MGLTREEAGHGVIGSLACVSHAGANFSRTMVVKRDSVLELVEVAKEVLGRLVNCYAAGSDVLVDLALALLPPLGPEPALIGRHGQCGP